MAEETINQNQFIGLTAGSLMSDGTVEPLQAADPGASVAWTEHSNGAIVKLSAEAGFSVDCDAVDENHGVATVTAVQTLTDGRTFTATITVEVLAGVVTIVGATIIAGEPSIL